MSEHKSSRRAEVDEDGNEVIRLGCFTRAVVKCPCAWMWIFFLIAVVLAAVPIVTRRIEVDPQKFAGFDTDTLVEQVNYFTWVRAVRDDENVYAQSTSTSSGVATTSGFRVLSMNAIFLYEALDTSGVLTADNVAAMVAFEGAMLADPTYAGNCKLVENALNSTKTACGSPNTVLTYLHKNDALHETQCNEGWCAAAAFVPPAAVNNYCTTTGAYGTWPCTSTIYDWRDGTLAAESEWPALLYERLCNLPSPHDAYAAGVMRALLPTDVICDGTDLTASDVRSLYDMQRGNETVREWHDKNAKGVETLVAALNKAQDTVSATPSTGLSLASAPVGGKKVNALWGPKLGWADPTGRIFFRYLFRDLALAGFSVALVILILLLNTQSGALTAAGLFEILASLPLAMFGWMLIGQTFVSTLELLGIFLILCIGADDIFVFTDTWKESAYMPKAISGSLQSRFAWTYSRAASAMLTTTATTCITLVLNAASPFPLLRSFGVFNMFVVFFDYLLVITWYAATTLSLTQVATSACPPGRNFECSCCCPGASDADFMQKKRASTAFMREKLAPCLRALRWVLPLLTLGLVGGGAAILSQNFEEGEFKQFPASHPFEKYGTIQADHFGDTREWKRSAVVIYGLEAGTPVNFPKSNNFFLSTEDDYRDMFTPRYSGTFDFGPAEQQKIVADCDALAADANVVFSAQTYCLLNELKASDPSAFPYATEADLRTALEAFYASSTYTTLKADYSSYASYTGFITDGSTGIAALWHSFNTTIPTTVGRGLPGLIRPYHNDWRTAIDATCSAAAPCVSTNREGLFSSMQTLMTLRDSALVNIALAIAVSYGVLVMTTFNLIVPFLALISISSTIVCSLAVVFLAGFKFDGNAAILSVMAVGLAVDYTVHIVHFYNEATGNRYEKAADALHGVGISICGGAVTTGGAALPLLFAQSFLFFQMAGWFVLFTALFSLFFTFFQLTPLLMAIGPSGDTGDLLACFRSKKSKVKATADSASSVNA